MVGPTEEVLTPLDAGAMLRAAGPPLAKTIILEPRTTAPRAVWSGSAVRAQVTPMPPLPPTSYGPAFTIVPLPEPRLERVQTTTVRLTKAMDDDGPELTAAPAPPSGL